MNITYQGAQAELDRLIDDADGDSNELLIRVKLRKGDGQLFPLTVIGPPPPELDITQWIECLFGGQRRYNLSFGIRGFSGKKAIKSVELDLRESMIEPREMPRGGWKNVGLSAEELDALDPDDIVDDDDDADDLDDDAREYSNDPLVRELLMEAREERRSLEARLRVADRERDRDRRAEATRSHELTLALIGSRNAEPAAAAAATDPLTEAIKKRLLKESTDRIMGVAGAGGVDNEEMGLFDSDSQTFLAPALRAFGKRMAEKVAEDDDDDDDAPEENGDELVAKAGKARARRDKRRAAAAAELKRREKQRRAKAPRNGARRRTKTKPAAPTKESEPQVD